MMLMGVLVVLVFVVFARVADPKRARRRLQAGAARVAPQIHEDKHAQRRRRASRHAQGQGLALHPQAGLLSQRGLAPLVSCSGAKQKKKTKNTKINAQRQKQEKTKNKQTNKKQKHNTHFSLPKVVLPCLSPSLYLSTKKANKRRQFFWRKKSEMRDGTARGRVVRWRCVFFVGGAARVRRGQNRASLGVLRTAASRGRLCRRRRSSTCGKTKDKHSSSGRRNYNRLLFPRFFGASAERSVANGIP